MPPRSPRYYPIYQRLVASGVLETFVARVNAMFKVPTTVTVAVEECGAANAFYQPTYQRISFCYELMEQLAHQFQGRRDYDALFSGTFMFVLLHELGHSLIDVLQLPVTGREEDAADQIAVLFLLTDRSGSQRAESAAVWFAANANTTALNTLAFHDEHSLDAQRFYNVICWIYGEDPADGRSLLSHLPASRAQRCPSEYRQMKRSWEAILADHLRSR